ncbi:MAG: hypothetical protein LLG44_06170 [Chloroflexi bacterium]|nr:hypothetical protein [Chloroflexota bacterium]
MQEPTCLMLGVLIVIAFIVMMLVIAWIGGRSVDVLVGQKTRALDEILRTGDVPVSWRQPHVKRVAHMRDAARVHEIKSRAKADYLHKLTGLQSYVQKTTLVADEETRESVLQQLASIQSSWEVKDADEF